MLVATMCKMNAVKVCVSLKRWPGHSCKDVTASLTFIAPPAPVPLIYLSQKMGYMVEHDQVHITVCRR